MCLYMIVAFAVGVILWILMEIIHKLWDIAEEKQNIKFYYVSCFFLILAIVVYLIVPDMLYEFIKERK